MILETSQLLSWGGAWDGRRGQRREFHTVQQSPVGSASHKLLCVCGGRGVELCGLGGLQNRFLLGQS